MSEEPPRDPNWQPQSPPFAPIYPPGSSYPANQPAEYHVQSPPRFAAMQPAPRVQQPEPRTHNYSTRSAAAAAAAAGEYAPYAAQQAQQQAQSGPIPGGSPTGAPHSFPARQGQDPGKQQQQQQHPWPVSGQAPQGSPSGAAKAGRPNVPTDFWNVGPSAGPSAGAQPSAAPSTESAGGQPAASTDGGWGVWAPPAQAQQAQAAPQMSGRPPGSSPAGGGATEMSSPWHVPPASSDPPKAAAISPSVSASAVEIQTTARMLRKAGYVQMASMLEMDLSRNSIGLSDQQVGKNVVGQQFVAAAKRLGAKENPLASFRNFVLLYSSFWNWSLTAIDSVRESLREIAFVVFVELWSRLLSLCLKRAAAFLRKFADGHLSEHREEIHEMKKVQALQCIRDLPFVIRVLRGERFHIKVDFLTRKLLTTRLTLDNDTVILDILQKRVSFDTPADVRQSCVAVLASNYYRPAGSQDVGGAIVTPSLAVLCGLQPNPLEAAWDERIIAGEPSATYLNSNVSSLYRLPTAASASLAWRHKAALLRKTDAVLRRVPVSPDKLPSILNLGVNLQSTWPEIGGAESLSADVVALQREAGEMLAISDRSTGAVWVWRLPQAAWQRCCDYYKREIFNPWLVKYARSRLTDSHDLGRAVDDLEDSGVFCQMGADQVRVSGHKLDLAMSQVAAMAECPNEAEELLARLQEPGLGDRSAQPLCLNGHSLPVTGFSFLSPFLMGGASSLALSGSYDGFLNLWDLDHSVPLASYRSGSAILSVDTDPCFGYSFLSGHQDRAACLWIMEKASPLRVLNRHGGPVSCVRFHPNSTLLATGSSDNCVRLWDPRVADIVGLIHDVSSPRLIEFSPNGKYVAVAPGGSSVVQVWDMVAGRLLNTFDVAVTGAGGVNSSYVNSSYVNSSYVDFCTSMSIAHGSELLATTTASGHLQLWDLVGSVSRAGKGVEEPTVPVVDLSGYEANLQLISDLRDTKKRGCVAEYAFGKERSARLASFSETNVLFSVTT